MSGGRGVSGGRVDDQEAHTPHSSHMGDEGVGPLGGSRGGGLIKSSSINDLLTSDRYRGK